MTIEQLINALQERAKLSDNGLQAKVEIHVHAVEFGEHGSVTAQFEDVMNVWGVGIDDVEIHCSLSYVGLDVLSHYAKQRIE